MAKQNPPPNNFLVTILAAALAAGGSTLFGFLTNPKMEIPEPLREMAERNLCYTGRFHGEGVYQVVIPLRLRRYAIVRTTAVIDNDHRITLQPSSILSEGEGKVACGKIIRVEKLIQESQKDFMTCIDLGALKSQDLSLARDVQQSIEFYSSQFAVCRNKT